MQNIMEQARKIQADMEKASKQIGGTEYTAEKVGVKVKINGKGEVLEVSLANDDLLKDKELVEDMLTLLFNEVLTKWQKDKDEKLGKYTNGVGGLF